MEGSLVMRDTSNFITVIDVRVNLSVRNVS